MNCVRILRKKKISEFETNSSRCDDVDETDSSDSFEVLIESKPSSQVLPQASSRAPKED